MFEIAERYTTRNGLGMTVMAITHNCLVLKPDCVNTVLHYRLDGKFNDDGSESPWDLMEKR